ncbi:MAG: PucR family transcriptional regulator ligand-binding domain-containing protein [Acidimicrobiia bacterium]
MWDPFDVGAVIASLPGDDAVVVAGAGGMNRKVSRARMAATLENVQLADPDELVVATAEAIAANGETWDEFVHRLETARVAALAVRLDAAEPLPLGLLAAADRLTFPVIAFPATSALADVTTAILNSLLYAQGQRLDRFRDIHQRFTSVVLAGGSATEIAKTLHELVGWPVVILDHAGRQAVVVPADTDSDPLIETGIRQPILAADHVYGELIVLTDGTVLDDDQALALERASAAIAVRQAHASAVAAEQERFAATSLEELIAGHPGSTTEVTERAISFGWDLLRPRAVLLASIDPPTDRERMPNALATIAAAARATLGREAIIWTRSTTIAALIAPHTADSSERRRIAEDLRYELDERLRTVNVSIGVGRRVDDPMDLQRSYLEASRSVDVGRWAKGRHVTEVFDELGLERLLASTPTDDLTDFVKQAIGPLVQHDHLHRTDLVETLSVWLETRNMAEAARLVHVHYNTFKNRLDRIESIIGPLTNDAARALECEVAIYVSRHYDGPWRRVSEM